MVRQAGLSLVELIVVLVIILVVGGLSLPSFVSWRSHAAYRSVAREIVSAMRLARSHAIARSREVEVDFDLEGNGYRLRVGNRADGSDTWVELMPWKHFPDQVRLAVTKDCDKRGDGDLSTPDIDTIQFNPNGTCGALGSMAGNYVCVMTTELQPRYAGAILSYSTGRAVVKTWNAARDAWEE